MEEVSLSLVVKDKGIKLTRWKAGFVVLWALNYVTLVAGGLAMETVLAIIGLTWLPFFLILWIIRELLLRWRRV